MGRSPLHGAVFLHQIQCIRILCEFGADIGVLDSNKCSPLHLAAQQNMKEVIQIFVANPNVDVNAPGERGCRPLHFSCFKDSVQCLNLLLEHGADPRLADKIGNRPIHTAVSAGAIKCAQALIEKGQQPPNEEAVVKISELSVKSVLQQDKSELKCSEMINWANKEGDTPLHLAVNTCDEALIKFCLTKSAKLDSVEEDGNSPVHYAAMKGYDGILKQLLEEVDEKVVRKLLKATNVNGHTPLHLASMLNFKNVVEYLITLGSALESVDKLGWTPLLASCSRVSSSTTFPLIEAGADPSAVDNCSRNAIHLLVLSGVDKAHNVLESLVKVRP
ncbi:hypothetical protein Ciccas_013974 [Cichlidogyrus casuarinus]|uniref:Uncharacterized protein n=1 Tax=Cichlidogyrus casuarinus TaxID=1844966 RepID=A0ABD2PK86_9PLAT